MHFDAFLIPIFSLEKWAFLKFFAIFLVFWPKFPPYGENGTFLGVCTHFRPFFQKNLKNMKNLENFSYLYRPHIKTNHGAKIH